MKLIFYIIVFLGPFFISCRKHADDKPAPPRGINYDLLLKTVDTYADGVSTTNYTYNGSKQLIRENSLRTFIDGTKWAVTNNWFRGPGGRLDSMTSEYTYGSDPTGLQKQYYYYDASGTLTYSIFFRNINSPVSSVDSSVYTYSGTTIIKRFDFTSAKTTILFNTLTHELYYQYDSQNNISAIKFVNYDFSDGFPPKKDTVVLSYFYDAKKNPYYQNEAFYAYFANLAFEDYASSNNIVEILYSGSSTTNDKDIFSLQYNQANKPDRVLVASYGLGTVQPEIWTTDYYYD